MPDVYIQSIDRIFFFFFKSSLVRVEYCGMAPVFPVQSRSQITVRTYSVSYFLSVCLGFLWVLQFPPTVQKPRWFGDSNYS